MRTKIIVASVVLSSLFLFPLFLFASDLGPTAAFTISPSSGSLESTFTFDASSSYDERGFSNALEYRWSFDYPDSGFSDWSTQSTARYEYSSFGEKTVALEVRDENSATDRTYSTLTVWEEAIYEGWFTVSPLEGDVDTVFTFEANISTKSSVPKSEYQVRWDFDGDGVYDTDYTSSTLAYHNYPETGTYLSRMELLSPDGTSLEVIGYDHDDEDEIPEIYVSKGQSPQASLSSYPSTGSVNATFYFDSSDSFDAEDHHELETRWDFNGDGQFELDWSEETNPTTSYSLAGTYEVILQVRDSEEYIDQASVTLTVTENNFAPEAAFTITSDSDQSDETVGTTSTTFSFNASSSKDEEDASGDLQVRWDFDGDGDYDTTFDATKKAKYRYLDDGTYEVALQVLDSSGQTDIAYATIRIVDNDAPLAFFEVSPLRGTLGTTFYFDASSSSDNQYKTSSLEVRWDWEGDGTYDTPFATDKTTTHRYENTGSYDVRLQVRDPEDQTSLMSQTVEVLESTAPIALLSVAEQEGTFSTLFHFDASTSYDNETDFEDLYFRWDFDYTGLSDITYDTSWGHTTTKSIYFDTKTGEIQIRVEVKDAEENISTGIVSVDIHWASSYMDHLKDKGIIRGYEGGDLAPDQYVTRAELLKMSLKSLGISDSGHTYQGYFSDVAKGDWHDGYVEKAFQMGIVSGYDDGTFKPNNPVTRSEAVKILVTSFELDLETYTIGTFSDVFRWDWFADFVATAYEYGLLNGYSDGTFGSQNLMTRGEASKILSLALQGGL